MSCFRDYDERISPLEVQAYLLPQALVLYLWPSIFSIHSYIGSVCNFLLVTVNVVVILQVEIVSLMHPFSLIYFLIAFFHAIQHDDFHILVQEQCD